MDNISSENRYGKEQKIADILRGWGYVNPCSIGEGAFATVYRVWDEKSERILACKVSKQRRMLERENRLLQQISHPLFPKNYEIRTAGDDTFLFMDYVPGRSLKRLLGQRGRMAERQAIRIVKQLAEGLQYLHELPEPIFFLDLKPENIMVRENGDVMLLDFGSAGTEEQSSGILTGTLGYAAPEQLQTGGKAGTYSDVYGLGKVMCHIITGEGIVSFANQDGRAGHPYRKVSVGLEELLAECMCERISQRIPDMRCFLQRLSPFLSGRKRDRFFAEVKAFFCRKQMGDYLYEKGVVKHPMKTREKHLYLRENSVNIKNSEK